MGPHRKMGIYVGYSSPSIMKYLEPLTGDLFAARYADCIFDEDNFPTLGGEKNHKECREIDWNVEGIHSLDPRTNESELEVQKIINLRKIANNLPDAFTDYKGVTKSHVPAMNVPERVEISKTTQPPKRGRNLDKKDKASQKRPRGMRNPQTVNVGQPRVDIQPSVEKGHLKDVHHPGPSTSVHTNVGVGTSKHLDSIVEGNHDESEGIDEISTNYVETGESFNRNTTNVDIFFSSKIAKDLTLDREPKTMAECMKRSDWSKWKVAIEDELRSLTKRGVFTAVIPTPRHISPVGAKWDFVRKRNENNEVVRYKVRLVAQGFTQKPDIDYDETYSPVMSGITFRYLISLCSANEFVYPTDGCGDCIFIWVA
jgi:hypothetical protein